MKSCVQDAIQLKAERELEERGALLQAVRRDLPLCLLELEELRRGRDLKVARQSLERSELPSSVQARLPSLQLQVAREEQAVAVRCQSLATYRLNLENGVPLNEAKEAHVERITAQSIEMLKDYNLLFQK